MEPNTMTYVLRGSAENRGLGGKAENLRRLANAGLPVPLGSVVHAETADGEIDDAVAEIAARFSGERVAVRSSGSAEDSDETSFAGQFDTILNVEASGEAISQAVRRVRASATQSAVAAYADAPIEMSVLVMPMVAADAAGVAFTRDPVTAERVVVVEAVKGLGDKLASGAAMGERWRVGEATVLVHELGVLTPDQAEEVADLARRCEMEMGSPQDIEWAIENGVVVLLQSRAITTVDDIEPVPMDDEIPPGPWEWDSAHNRLPMTPLTSSSFAPGFEAASRRLAETYGIPISHLDMRTINGYLYIQAVPPAGKPGQPVPPKAIMRAMFRVVPLLRQRRKAAEQAWDERVDRQLLEQWRTTVRPATEDTVDRWYDIDRAALTNSELAGLLNEAVDLQRATFEWNMITDPAYMLPLAALHRFVVAEFDGTMETTTKLLAGAAPSEYRTSAVALREMMSPAEREAVAIGGGVASLNPETERLYEAHLRRHGPKVLGFDLSNAAYMDHPARELARIATMPDSRDPGPDAEELAVALRAALTPERAVAFDALLSEARNTYPIREEGEAVHSIVMGMVRLFAMEVGDRMVATGHLNDREHVVFLDLDEITTWLDSPFDPREIVQRRRGEDLWARGQSPEPFLGPEDPTPPLDVFPPAVQRNMELVQLIMTHDARPAVLTDDADGVAASPGTYTGPVRLVEGPHEFDKVQAGDVLVAPLTISPWEILFPHVGALVTEGGGLLSHPAIVAREYALPAVVGCEGAMRRFHDGQLVRVDGAAGTVTPIEESKGRKTR